jgi:hypothetical protein
MLRLPHFSAHPVGRSGRERVGLARPALLVCLSAFTVLVVAACAGALAFPMPDHTSIVVGPSSSPPADLSAAAPAQLTIDPSPTPSPSPLPTPAASPVATHPPQPTAPPPAKAPAKPAGAPRANSLAIPALGINAPIGTSKCGGLIPNGIWRWPCAGHDNMYLLGHAWGVFAPLHDGYHAGLLKPGLIALYTDASGVVRKYSLQWVQDLPVATWGQGAVWAATPGPVITLQTCDGATSDHRIIVRFVPA